MSDSRCYPVYRVNSLMDAGPGWVTNNSKKITIQVDITEVGKDALQAYLPKIYSC